ncbi:MAG TPA: sulfite exporter TauE/SafE family protein [Candidatus Saccharimonadales bacterium]|nr:sulfite exporter TauE/SafE family protein [Candidatus Saccharimonadales bacterium]
MDITQTIIAAIAGVAAGFIGAVTGGGGLLSIPVLLFLGLPVDVAIGTNRFSAFGLIAAAVPEYYRAKKIRWGVAFKLVPLAMLGGLIGSKALVHINTDTLSVIVGVLLLLMIPVVFMNHNKGMKNVKTGERKTLAGYSLFFLIMIYGGFFGGGAAMFAIYTLIYFLGFTYIQANATDFIAWSFLSAVALAVFLFSGLVNFQLGIPLMIGMYIGGALGARVALEKGNAWVRVLFILVLTASAVKLLFFR